MSRLGRTIHTRWRPTYGPAAAIIPDARLDTKEEVHVLGFLSEGQGDPEAHLFVLTEKDREKLVRLLTGGVIVSGAILDGKLPGAGGNGG